MSSCRSGYSSPQSLKTPAKPSSDESTLAQTGEEFKIRRVLVAVDGSENSLKAVKVAAGIAKSREAELTVLHVLTLPVAAYYGDVPVQINKIEDEMRPQSEKYVSDAVSLAERNGVRAGTKIIERIESPVKGITDYASENDIDLIVVGTRGMGGFKRLLLGSVAAGVVHYAHCSVLVVR